ncbi:TetR/AcrR family transcriptional regulator [Maribacter litoralis]|uniref:TetR/AcrR family transcriptional regulator n=1 Tax=Maribacter litoralis TaxID=2059726 RepID=UPI003F5CD125|tara:strand:+ start:72 stop:662 length:591 start_codon:yes stop_codon:yes gene_type:complete
MNYKHNKEQVVKKGMELFWAKGFHKLGINEICKETGMTKGAFYNSFESKESFLLTTITAYGELLVVHLQSQLKTSKLSAFDKLIELYENMLKTQTKNNYKGCLVNNIMSEMGSLNNSVAELSAQQFNNFLQVIAPTVKDAQQNGDLSNSINSDILTEIIHTTFFGFLTRSKGKKDAGHLLMTSFLNTIKTNKNGNN